MSAGANSIGAERRYILMALAPMIAGIVVFTTLSIMGVAENKPPVASFTYSPSSPSTVDTIHFTDASSDEDGYIVSWLWDFGDGTTSTAPNPTHQYTSSGTYPVTLTVTDDKGGTDEHSSAVNVAPLEEKMFQNFESGNGTPGPYFREIYHANAGFENLTVCEGSRSAKMTVTVENGGTIAINAASSSGYLNLQGAQTLSLRVYDTQGNNTIQLRLRDSGGDGGSGNDNNFLWSTMSSIQNVWTLITWDLSQYPQALGLDFDKIALIELYEWYMGTYYFDNVSYTQ